jgi:signal transduction histidine kinase
VPRIRAWTARHSWVLDACLAGALAAVVGRAAGTTDLLGWLSIAGVFAPLAWRRRAPVVVCWTVLGCAGGSLLFDLLGAHLLLGPLFAIYAVARYRPRRFLWPPVAAVEVPLAVGWLWNGGPWWDLVALTAILAATVLLGAYLRTRRAYLAELEERARRLERERDQQSQLAVAAERARIAREMHDIVAHHLAVMVALADGAALSAVADPGRATATMTKVSATGREALSEMRRLVGLLRGGEPPPGGLPGEPGERAPQPGLDDLDRLVDQVRAAGMRVAVTREGVPGDWGPGAGLAVYRIVQEALTNTLKHAGPRATAQVRLSYAAGGVDLEITDDGGGRPAGPAPAPPAGGHGVAGMVERATSYGGDVEAGPAHGAGWRVRARLRLDGRPPAGDRAAA